jgi:hypothetical protein
MSKVGNRMLNTVRFVNYTLRFAIYSRARVQGLRSMPFWLIVGLILSAQIFWIPNSKAQSLYELSSERLSVSTMAVNSREFLGGGLTLGGQRAAYDYIMWRIENPPFIPGACEVALDFFNQHERGVSVPGGIGEFKLVDWSIANAELGKFPLEILNLLIRPNSFTNRELQIVSVGLFYLLGINWAFYGPKAYGPDYFIISDGRMEWISGPAAIDFRRDVVVVSAHTVRNGPFSAVSIGVGDVRTNDGIFCLGFKLGEKP